MRIGFGMICGALGLALLTACGDGTGPGKDKLTEAEVEALLTSLNESIADLGDVSYGANGRFSVTLPCSVKGDIAATGMVVVSNGGLKQTTTNTLGYRKCKMASTRGPFTIEGTFLQNATFAIDTVANTLDINSRSDGSFDWNFDGRAGSCEMDSSYDYHETATTATETSGGSLCGVTLDKLNGA